MVRRTQDVHFLATKEEECKISEKMEEMGIKSRSAYLRKMALDGKYIQLDMPLIREMVTLLRRCSNNINQCAKRANETGSFHENEILEIKNQLNELWILGKEIIVKLSEVA